MVDALKYLTSLSQDVLACILLLSMPIFEKKHLILLENLQLNKPQMLFSRVLLTRIMISQRGSSKSLSKLLFFYLGRYNLKKCFLFSNMKFKYKHQYKNNNSVWSCSIVETILKPNHWFHVAFHSNRFHGDYSISFIVETSGVGVVFFLDL